MLFFHIVSNTNHPNFSYPVGISFRRIDYDDRLKVRSNHLKRSQCFSSEEPKYDKLSHKLGSDFIAFAN